MYFSSAQVDYEISQNLYFGLFGLICISVQARRFAKIHSLKSLFPQFNSKTYTCQFREGSDHRMGLKLCLHILCVKISHHLFSWIFLWLPVGRKELCGLDWCRWDIAEHEETKLQE